MKMVSLTITGRWAQSSWPGPVGRTFNFPVEKLLEGASPEPRHAIVYLSDDKREVVCFKTPK